ncbi:Domain of unknown function DUF23 domain-containing protein [Strongyloides ratti]|uniref:Glycosyltransferase family 92 protein n=1 Tax=Strongyloides ratti TaxID=34506 RepID=A0A090LQT5_STRRB|nr:Domain of unknown function DUF23 domain-containing protein [Strongyloides ratti]CEF69951.1 Domain of unknown function DUF23 domain-containing protein [Strongyloides ratti]
MNNFIISINNNSYQEHNEEFHKTICKQSNYKCLYYPHQSYFDIPYDIAIKINKIEIMSKKSKKKFIFKLDKVAAKNKPFDGITVCTPLLYYYNNWLQMFMFLEKWKREGNSKVIIYYKSLSNDVYELLKYYKKLGLVYMIPTPEISYNDPLMKFTETSFGMGPLFFNDCMYRNNTKYLTVMDVDEYFHIFDKKYKKNGLVNFIEMNSQLYPNIGFFNFKSFYISYINDNVTNSFDFAINGLLTDDKLNKGGKSIMLTNKIYYPCYHMPLFKNLDEGFRFSENQAIILHARPNYIFKKNVHSNKKCHILDKWEKLDLISSYEKLKNTLNSTIIFSYKPTIIKNLERCMKKKKKNDKNLCIFNIEPCKKKMSILGNWIYTNRNEENYQEYVKIK